MKYKFTYRRRWLKRKHIVVGHNYQEATDKMDLFLPDGGIISIPEWTKCQLWLGQDWVLAQKKALEKEAGREIRLNVEE